MLSGTHRFHGHGSLRYVFKNGQAIRSRFLTVKHTRNSRRRHSRFAVVVSKKVHKSAVGRNRMRRRIYEIVRGILGDVATPSDVVIIITSAEVVGMDAKELAVHVQELFRLAGLYKASDS